MGIPREYLDTSMLHDMVYSLGVSPWDSPWGTPNWKSLGDHLEDSGHGQDLPRPSREGHGEGGYGHGEG